MAILTKDELLGEALAVKRGDKRLTDIPTEHRSRVRSTLNRTSDGQMLAYANRTATQREPRQVGRPTKFRRAYGA